MKLSHFAVAALAFLATWAVVLTSCSSGRDVQKNEQIRNDSIANAVAVKVIEGKAFMLSADQISSGSGRSLTVTNNTNFIIVEGDQATIQFSPGIGGGPNGVGGFTFKGGVSFYKVKHANSGDVTVQFHFSSTLMSGDVSLTLYKRSTRATAYINSTYYRGKAQMWGTVKPLGASQIVEGQSW